MNTKLVAISVLTLIAGYGVFELYKYYMKMENDKFLINFIKGKEGFREDPYLDSANVPTIGYGFTYYADGRPVKMSDPAMKRSTADKMFLEILEPFKEGMEKAVKVKQNPKQMAALISMAYNNGVEAIRTSTLMTVINSGGTEKEIKKQFRRWVYAGGKYIPGLANRREKEILIYFS